MIGVMKMSDIDNGDMPANPVLDDWENFAAFLDGIKGGRNYGLTKREAFAMAAMQGIISSKYYADFCGENDGVDKDCAAARMAVIHADALLKELQ